jgi:CelD/BcsL family acetyltransferase involved in cellulose biosynthesis
MFAELKEQPGAALIATMQIALADPLRLPDEAAWADLADNACEPNPFFTPWFLKPALDHLSEGRKIWLATLSDGVRLHGLFPMAIRSHYGRMPAAHVGNWAHYQCFLGTPLIRAGMEADFWRALLLALDEAEWASGLLSITLLDPAGPVFGGLVEAAQSLGRPCPIVHRQQRALLQSDLTPEAYLEANVRGKKRKEWRRLENRLSELGAVEFSTFEGDNLEQWCKDFLSLEAAGWKGDRGAALGNTPQTQRFFLDVMANAQAVGALDMQKLTLDGRPIAMLVNFMTPPGSWSFKIAHDEDLARYSPGVMIELRNMARVLGNPTLQWMDSCAVENHPMIDSLWAERREVVQVSVPLKGLRRSVTWHLCRAAETASAALRQRKSKT